jgi:hypothetical protein
MDRSHVSNSLRRPVDTVDDRVLAWIEQNVLTESVVLETLAIMRRRLAERTASANTELPRLEERAAFGGLLSAVDGAAGDGVFPTTGDPNGFVPV